MPFLDRHRGIIGRRREATNHSEGKSRRGKKREESASLSSLFLPLLLFPSEDRFVGSVGLILVARLL